jgi:hypothetical protein
MRFKSHPEALAEYENAARYYTATRYPLMTNPYHANHFAIFHGEMR